MIITCRLIQQQLRYFRGPSSGYLCVLSNHAQSEPWLHSPRYLQEQPTDYHYISTWWRAKYVRLNIANCGTLAGPWRYCGCPSYWIRPWRIWRRTLFVLRIFTPGIRVRGWDNRLMWGFMCILFPNPWNKSDKTHSGLIWIWQSEKDWITHNSSQT